MKPQNKFQFQIYEKKTIDLKLYSFEQRTERERERDIARHSSHTNSSHVSDTTWRYSALFCAQTFGTNSTKTSSVWGVGLLLLDNGCALSRHDRT